jgi:tetratricopeptide (TPR) repeat protein
LTFQQVFDRGLKAASQQQWEPAIQYFARADEQVRYSGTTYPGLCFNLALAHAKAGHDAIAIAWFEAYLAALPEASNAEAIRAEIRRLEAVLEAKAKLLFEEAIKAAHRMPEGSRSPLGSVSTVMGEAGYPDWAIETYRPQAGEYGGDAETALAQFRSNVLKEYAEALIDAHDVDGGLALLPQIAEPDHRDNVWITLAYYYSYRREPYDAERGLQAIEHLEDASYRDAHRATLEKRRQELATATSSTPSLPKTSAEQWSALARHELRGDDAQRLRDLQQDATLAAPTVATSVADIARDLRICQFKIHALRKVGGVPPRAASLESSD